MAKLGLVRGGEQVDEGAAETLESGDLGKKKFLERIRQAIVENATAFANLIAETLKDDDGTIPPVGRGAADMTSRDALSPTSQRAYSEQSKERLKEIEMMQELGPLADRVLARKGDTLACFKIDWAFQHQGFKNFKALGFKEGEKEFRHLEHEAYINESTARWEKLQNAYANPVEGEQLHNDIVRSKKLTWEDLGISEKTWEMIMKQRYVEEVRMCVQCIQNNEKPDNWYLTPSMSKFRLGFTMRQSFVPLDYAETAHEVGISEGQLKEYASRENLQTMTADNEPYKIAA